MTLIELQEKIRAWGEYNFPNAKPHQPLLGAVEELGELAHAHLKAEQGIRGTPEEWKAKKEDAIGDVVIYLLHYCVKEGLNFWKCILRAWNEIKDRDWIRFPRNGRTE
jgi:NTP pyrophosphatase (non-canonical NTP hydrolase)